MNVPQPIITRIGSPAEILSLDLIKEFVGVDLDVDAQQDRVLPVLRQAIIENGEQITGAVWAAAQYRIDGLSPVSLAEGFRLPISPVMGIAEMSGIDAAGNEAPVPMSAYHFRPSCIEHGRPWAEVLRCGLWPENAVSFSITCTAGWNAETFPDSLKSWALVRIATIFDNRDDVVTGAITAALPRDHTRGLLDRYTVRGNPYYVS